MAVLKPRVRRGLTYSLVAVVAFAAGGLVTSGADNDGPQAAALPSNSPGVLDQAESKIASDAEHAVSKATLEKAAVQGMLSVLNDRWSAYYAPSDYSAFSDALEGRYTGVGLWLRQATDGSITIASVQPDTPAAEAGVDANDTLVSVGATPATGNGIAAAAQALRGASGSKVAITVRTASGNEQTLTLTRTNVSSDAVTVERLSGGVLSIRIGAFTTGVGREVRQALAEEKGRTVSGVILDLRDNPGGLVTEAVEVASAFLDGGPVVSYDRRNQGTTTLTASAGGDTKTPLVVLVDGGTASAAEIVTAALQDRGRAVVVGSRTYGKGSVQEPARLADGSAIEITVGLYVTPNGRTIDGVGVEPDITVDPSAAPKVAEARALDVLDGLVAAVGTTGRG